jgi:class 3 adenylate cyclase
MTTAEDPDLLVFADEAPTAAEAPSSQVWKLLVVDDEPEIHEITRLALGSVRIDGHPLAILSVNSASAARVILQAHSDIAVILLDVVMESEDAGLELVQWIRGELGNSRVRIVLRTGQPGHAPEQRVMFDYDINDYRDKTEVTAQRLTTTVLGAVRSYRDLCTIESHKVGLEHIVRSSAALFERQSVDQFITGVLQQLSALVSPQESAMFFQGRDLGFDPAAVSPTVVAGTGRFQAHVGQPVSHVVEDEVWQDITTMLRTRRPVLRRAYNIFGIFGITGVADALGGARDEEVWAAVFMEGLGELSAWDQRLIELFCQNASVALENHRLNRRQSALMQAFARFVPQQLLALLGRGDATKAGLGDQIQREMTVVFVDLRAFTSRAEQQSPAATFEYLNAYFAVIVPEIHGNGGVVDKYLGDGLMALFPDAPASAVRAALGVVERSRELGAGVGVGVHLGAVTLGLVGAAGRMESTVVSDAVNIAARIERLTRRFGADLLISAAVQSMLPPSLQADTRPLGDYVVPGKRQPVVIHEVFAGDPPELRAAKRASREAVAAAVARMTAGELTQAAVALAELSEACPNDQVLPGLVEECRRREGRA